MSQSEAYLSCPRRAGQPRVAEAVCRACKKGGRCPAWRDFVNPPLFPDLSLARRGHRTRA